MSFYNFKPQLWPTIMTIPILILLLYLGNWQVERLEWKLGLIKQIETRAFMDPIRIPPEKSNLDDLEYLSVQITGRFNNQQEMTLYSVGPNGEAGYDLYTPFTNNDGKIIIVNRGWVPERIKDQVSRLETIKNVEHTVTGLLRKPSIKLWYGPENEPQNNNWFYGDLDGMARTYSLGAVYPMYLYAAVDDHDPVFPVAGRTEFNIVNNHLDYALTWYGLAIVLLVIYVIFCRQPKKS